MPKIVYCYNKHLIMKHNFDDFVRQVNYAMSLTLRQCNKIIIIIIDVIVVAQNIP